MLDSDVLVVCPERAELSLVPCELEVRAELLLLFETTCCSSALVSEDFGRAWELVASLVRSIDCLDEESLLALGT